MHAFTCIFIKKIKNILIKSGKLEKKIKNILYLFLLHGDKKKREKHLTESKYKCLTKQKVIHSYWGFLTTKSSLEFAPKTWLGDQNIKSMFGWRNLKF